MLDRVLMEGVDEIKSRFFTKLFDSQFLGH